MKNSLILSKVEDNCVWPLKQNEDYEKISIAASVVRDEGMVSNTNDQNQQDELSIEEPNEMNQSHKDKSNQQENLSFDLEQNRPEANSTDYLMSELIQINQQLQEANIENCETPEKDTIYKGFQFKKEHDESSPIKKQKPQIDGQSMEKSSDKNVIVNTIENDKNRHTIDHCTGLITGLITATDSDIMSGNESNQSIPIQTDNPLLDLNRKLTITDSVKTYDPLLDLNRRLTITDSVKTNDPSSSPHRMILPTHLSEFCKDLIAGKNQDNISIPMAKDRKPTKTITNIELKGSFEYPYPEEIQSIEMTTNQQNILISSTHHITFYKLEPNLRLVKTKYIGEEVELRCTSKLPFRNEIFIGYSDSNLELMQIEENMSLTSIKKWGSDQSYQIRSISMTPDNMMFTCGFNNVIKQWNSWGEIVAEYSNRHDGWIEYVKVSPDGQFLLTSGYSDSRIKKWKIDRKTRGIILESELL